MTQTAYSTSDDGALSAYREWREWDKSYVRTMRNDLKGLGVGPTVYMTRGSGIIALEQVGDYVPEGWRRVRGRLEPRRGKPGEAARRWLSDHAVRDIREILAGHGLPRKVWVPRPGQFGYRACAPEILECAGELWALYEMEPGTGEPAFKTDRCTWTPRRLSEFHAAREALEDQQTGRQGQ